MKNIFKERFFIDVLQLIRFKIVLTNDQYITENWITTPSVQLNMVRLDLWRVSKNCKSTLTRSYFYLFLSIIETKVIA